MIHTMETMIRNETEALSFSAEDWDRLRFRFHDSLLADTEISKLAKNLGRTWPIRGKAETPLKYVGYNLIELCSLPEFYGKGNRLPVLYQILSETIAFDEPFAEMVEHLDAAAEQANPAHQTLAELAVTLDFPIVATGFTEETRRFCANEGILTLADLIEFSQKMARTIVVGGDFRCFLNALASAEFAVLKQFLPLREGCKGLHLAEAIGQLAEQFSPAEAATLLKLYGLPLEQPSWQGASVLDRAGQQALIVAVRDLVAARLALFPDQGQELRHAVDSGDTALVRYFAPLQQKDRETLALAVVYNYFEVKPRANGLLQRLFSR